MGLQAQSSEHLKKVGQKFGGCAGAFVKDCQTSQKQVSGNRPNYAVQLKAAVY